MWLPLHRLPCPSALKKRKANYDWLDSEEEMDDIYSMYGLLATPVRDIESPEFICENGLRIGHSSIQGHRPTNEDSHVIDTKTLGGNYTIAALFDGHAGPEAAIFASENIVKIIKENDSFKLYMKSNDKNDELLKTALTESFVKLDQDLRNTDAVVHEVDRSGCTAVVVILTPTHIICASVGDSRAVVGTLKENNLEAVPLSEDHSPANTLEKNRIIKAGGFVQYDRVNGELAMSRAIGDFQYKSNKKFSQNEQLVISIPDVFVHKRSKNDKFMLIACDGVFDVFSNQEAIDALHDLFVSIDQNESSKEQKITAALVNSAVDKGSTDNVSAIVISF